MIIIIKLGIVQKNQIIKQLIMDQKEKTTRIKKMVNTWNKARWDHEESLRLLNSGAFFTIEPEIVALWSGDNPGTIHAYFGVENDKLYFILIDELTDRIPLDQMTNIDLEKIFIIEFNNDMELLAYDFINEDKSSTTVTKEEALSRVLRWQMMKETWIIDQIQSPDDDQVGIARVFTIPFSDLQNITSSKTVKNIAAVMGLKFRQKGVVKKVEGDSIYLLDLTFWGIEPAPETHKQHKSDNKLTAPIEDLSAICPPYPAGAKGSYSIQFS